MVAPRMPRRHHYGMFDMANYSYNVYAIPTAIASVAVLFLGLWVLIRERPSPVSISFFLITFVMSIWFFAFTWMYCATSADTALIWAKVAYLGVPFIPAAINHFTAAVLHLYQRRKILVWLSWALSIFFSASIVGTDALISQVHHYWWGYYPEYGWLSVPYVVFFFGLTLMAMHDYWTEYKKIEPGIHKLRIKWFMIAFGVLYFGAVDYLAKYDIPVYPFGYLPVIAFVLIASLTIMRYRLADLTPEFAASQILETMHGAVLVADLNGDIRVVNRAACALLGHPESELTAMSINRFADTTQNERINPQQLMREGIVHNYEMPWRLQNGQTIDVSVSASVVNDQDGFAAGIVYVVFDVIERKRAEEARIREERYALAVRGARDGLWDWNLKTDEIFFSERWKAMLGLDESEIGTSIGDWFQRIHTDELGRVRQEINAHLEGQTPHYESEHRMLHKDGTYRWILCRGIAVRDSDGKALRFAGSQTDVTERVSTAEQIAHQALYDPMTHLANRTLLIDILRRSIARAKRDENYKFAVLFLDLDRFKVINDSLGHMVGDQLLINISRRLEACVRANDTVARFGGDEFLVLLDDIKANDEPTLLANRLQQQISLPLHFDRHEIHTTASIGIALSSSEYNLPEEMLRDADTAMYSAKTLGKARAKVFNKRMHTDAIGLWEMEADLHRALKHEEFRVHYQPIVSLISGEITGVEALVRWQHPRKGLIYPEDFISLAEETGLIKPMGYWLLNKACAQTRLWHECGFKLRVAVNVSVKQFQDHMLLELIKTVLNDTGLAACDLELEITESIAMANAESGMVMLHALREMGIFISIDDFGTGYSSLAYLKRLPFNSLKIDRSFLADVAPDNDNGALASAIITMAHSLKLNVIAEGVETEQQLAFLHAEGCDEMQGYLINRPVPAEMFTEFLRKGPYLFTHPHQIRNAG